MIISTAAKTDVHCEFLMTSAKIDSHGKSFSIICFLFCVPICVLSFITIGLAIQNNPKNPAEMVNFQAL